MTEFMTTSGQNQDEENIWSDFGDSANWETVSEQSPVFSHNLLRSNTQIFEIPSKPERQTDDFEQQETIISFDEAIRDLSDPRYELWGHGTTNANNASSILQQGLIVGGEGRDTDMDSNFAALGHDSASLKEALNHWKHNNSKNIIFFRPPVKYKLPFRSNTKEMYSTYYHDDNSDNNDRGVYERDYIYGYYDAITDKVHLNPHYHGNIDDMDDTKYMETVYDNIKDTYVQSLPEEERQDWESLTNMYYDYQP